MFSSHLTHKHFNINLSQSFLFILSLSITNFEYYFRFSFFLLFHIFYFLHNFQFMPKLNYFLWIHHVCFLLFSFKISLFWQFPHFIYAIWKVTARIYLYLLIFIHYSLWWYCSIKFNFSFFCDATFHAF